MLRSSKCLFGVLVYWSATFCPCSHRCPVRIPEKPIFITFSTQYPYHTLDTWLSFIQVEWSPYKLSGAHSNSGFRPLTAIGNGLTANFETLQLLEKLSVRKFDRIDMITILRSLNLYEQNHDYNPHVSGETFCSLLHSPFLSIRYSYCIIWKLISSSAGLSTWGLARVAEPREVEGAHVFIP